MKIKDKVCTQCKARFTPKYSSLQSVCSFSCATEETNTKNKVKKISTINKVSKKRREDIKLYQVIRAVYMNNHCICERCHNKHSDALHHKAGREGKMLYNQRYFMSVCNSCHDYIHANPNESMEKGWLITKIGKKD